MRKFTSAMSREVCEDGCMTTYTYRVQRHDETGWWQLVENDVVIGAWEKKGDAVASYRFHAALAVTGHKVDKP